MDRQMEEPMDGWTDGWTDEPINRSTNQRTHPLIKMCGHIYKPTSKSDANTEQHQCGISVGDEEKDEQGGALNAETATGHQAADKSVGEDAVATNVVGEGTGS